MIDLLTLGRPNVIDTINGITTTRGRIGNKLLLEVHLQVKVNEFEAFLALFLLGFFLRFDVFAVQGQE